MVDTVTSKTVFKGRNRLVMQFTNISDGTGETNVTKVDRSTLDGPQGRPTTPLPPGKLRIDWIQYSVQGFEGLKISWDDTATGPADETAVLLAGDGYKSWIDVGGLNPLISAATLTSAVGDLLFSTVGTAAANDTYDVTISLRLNP